VASAQDTRSQARNRAIALERLQARVENALRVRKSRRATKPSKAATEKRLQSKRRQSERKAARRRPVDE
jgi:ribosome-associated protein